MTVVGNMKHRNKLKNKIPNKEESKRFKNKIDENIIK